MLAPLAASSSHQPLFHHSSVNRYRQKNVSKTSQTGVSLGIVFWNNERVTVRCSALVLAMAWALAAPTSADQRYQVSGNDHYQVGRSDLQTSIVYAGTQLLAIKNVRGSIRFTARARYIRNDAAGAVTAHATFVQVMDPQGELRDQTDLDPDYLTVLNQPFAIELDRQTRTELGGLHGRVPFLFPAPMAGGTLHGYLQRGPDTVLDGQPVLAVGFDADGPMLGPLPDQTDLSISGRMHMRGTAYYALRGVALLLGLNEDLTISGTIDQNGSSEPVRIVYRRSIRADRSVAAPSVEAVIPPPATPRP